MIQTRGTARGVYGVEFPGRHEPADVTGGEELRRLITDGIRRARALRRLPRTAATREDTLLTVYGALLVDAERLLNELR